MQLPFIKLFADSGNTIEMLSDAEAGRLLKSLLRYANDQEPILSGNEKFVFGMLKAQMDRDAAGYQAYLDKQRENGKKGGRPRRNPENPPVFDKNPENPPVFPETQKSQDVCVDKDKEIYTHTKQPPEASAGAPAREGWFDPARPDAPDDGAWRYGESARKATAGRLLRHFRQILADRTLNTEAGPLGPDIFDALTAAMECGITPQQCAELAHGCDSLWQWDLAVKEAGIEWGASAEHPEWRDQVREAREEA